MDTIDMIVRYYTEVADGMKKVEFHGSEASVKAYQMGKLIRIDIQEVEDE